MLFFKRPMRPQNADGPATAAPASIVQARSSAVLGMPPPLPPPVAQIQQIPAAAAATAAPVGTNRDNPIEVDASRTPKSADVAQQQPQQPHQQQQQFSVAGAPDAAAPTPSLWQQQLRTSNVVLTFPIDGIERVADAYLQTIVVQVAMEIVGCEAQNLGIRAVVAEADGCVLLRVFGLSRIVAKTLAQEQWSLNPEQAECVRSATYDSKFDHVRIELARANQTSSDATAAAAAASATKSIGGDSSDASDSTDDNMSDDARVKSPPPPRVPPPPPSQYSVRGLVSVAAQHQQQQQFPASEVAQEPPRRRRTREPAHSLLVAMDADEDAIADAHFATPVPASAPEKLQPQQKSTPESELDRRMMCLASVARSIAWVSGSTAVQRDVLSARAEIFVSRHHPAHNYCTVNVGGIVVFDKRLLITAYWTRGIPASYKHGFVVHFDTAKKELVVRISPPGQVDRLFHALRRIRAGDEIMPPPPETKKRRRRSSYDDEMEDGDGGDDDYCDDLDALGGFGGGSARKYRKL